MNKKKYLVIGIGVLFILAMSACLLQQETVNAQECRIIRVLGGAIAKKIRIEPETLWVSKGTCVIWYNWAKTREVKVIFKEGKRCDDVTDAPMGFKMTTDNCYVTSWIPLGGTSSLRFNEEGTFNYAIEGSGEVKAEGSILVTK